MSDELEQAHQRIAELEALLRAGEPPPPKKLESWLIAVVALIGLAGGVMLKLDHPSQKVQVSRTEFSPEIVADGALVLADSSLPALTEVDGRSYAVVRGLRQTTTGISLYGVAFDRATWKVAWRTDKRLTTEDNRGQLTLFKDRVYLADSGLEVTAWDVKTGQRMQSRPIPRRATTAQPTLDDPQVLSLGAIAAAPSNERAMLLDWNSGQIKYRESEPWVGCPLDRSAPCQAPLELGNPKLKAIFPVILDALQLQSGTDLVTLVQEHDAKQRIVAHALMWNADLSAPMWKTDFAAPTERTGLFAFANKRVFYLYSAADGNEHVSAIGFDHGDALYDVAIPGIEYGSTIGHFNADGDELFITANDALFVLDAKNGSAKKRISSF
jgi:hypothetical protein